MKKLLMFIYLLIGAFSFSYAQSYWTKEHLEADELLGRASEDVYVYKENNMGAFLYYTDNDRKVIKSSNAVFDYDSDHQVCVTIGFYDINKKLSWSDKYWFIVAQGGNIAYNGSFKDESIIIKYLKDYKGYVRFVCPRYAAGNFDLTVPCWKNPGSWKVQHKSPSKRYNKKTK